MKSGDDCPACLAVKVGNILAMALQQENKILVLELDILV